MPLADDIRTLRDSTLAALAETHDYYTDTKNAWRIVRKVIAAGGTFTFQNEATGTVTTPAGLAAKARRYVVEQLMEASFLQFVSIFESFFFDLLRLWLIAYPQSLIGKKVDFKTLLAAPDKDAVILLMIDKELNEILYERPSGWFANLESRAKLGCPTRDEIERIAEVKASRDVLVHNRGIAGKTYESKAGRLARYRAGDTIDVPEAYHRATWELLRKVVIDLSDAAARKGGG